MLATYDAVLRQTARPYRVDRSGRASLSQYPATTLDAASGLVSTARDLAAFSIALDTRTLLSDDTLAPRGRRRREPRGPRFGLGWFVQVYNGQPVVWHFGYAPDASSALFIHLPARHKTLILLANSDGLAAAFSLPNGDLTDLALRPPVPEPLRVILSSRGRTNLALVALLTLAAWAAFPSSASADLYFSPFIALKFGGETTLLDVDAVAGSNEAADKAKKVTWGGGVMWLGSGVLGVEGEIALTPGYFQGDPSRVLSSRVTTLLGNVVLAAPLTPHAGVAAAVRVGRMGLDACDFEHPSRVGARRTPGTSQRSTWVAASSACFRAGPDVRWDLRYLRGIGSREGDTLTGGARLTYWRASMAVVIRTR